MQAIICINRKEKSRIRLDTALYAIKGNYLYASIKALKWGRERLIISLATQ